MVKPGGGIRRDARTLPWYGWLGGCTLLAGAVGVLLDVAPIRILFYCVAWWSYIVLADACVWRRRGYSLVRNRPWEFWVLAFWSVPLWNIFELFNFRLQNWFYINVPTEWSFALIFNLTAYATVLPALFETYDLLSAYAVADRSRVRPWRIRPTLLLGSVVAGLGALAATLIWPRLAFPLVWGFAVLLGDPLCYLAGSRTTSLLGQLERGDARALVRLLAAGLICGGLWECWNYWAYTKWLYTVPSFEASKWFEMPPLGFLGFPPFALECYVCVNLLNAARRGRSWHAWDRTGPGASAWLATPAVVVALVFNGLTYAGIDLLTVKSVAPTLAELDGVPAETVDAVRRAGVTTPPAFLRHTATPERLAALARHSGIEQSALVALRTVVKLVDLEGLGAANGNALRRLGITSVEDLAAQDPALLYPQWRAEASVRPPTLAQVRLWVRAARRATAGAEHAE